MAFDGIFGMTSGGGTYELLLGESVFAGGVLFGV